MHYHNLQKYQNQNTKYKMLRNLVSMLIIEVTITNSELGGLWLEVDMTYGAIHVKSMLVPVIFWNSMKTYEYSMQSV